MSDTALVMARGGIFAGAWLISGGLFVILYAVETGGIAMSPWQLFVTAYLTAISALLLTRPVGE